MSISQIYFPISDYCLPGSGWHILFPWIISSVAFATLNRLVSDVTACGWLGRSHRLPIVTFWSVRCASLLSSVKLLMPNIHLFQGINLTEFCYSVLQTRFGNRFIPILTTGIHRCKQNEILWNKGWNQLLIIYPPFKPKYLPGIDCSFMAAQASSIKYNLLKLHQQFQA